MTTLNCRSMYVYQLAKVIQSEGSIPAMVDRARKAGIKSIWLKVANGKLRHQNITGNNKALFVALCSALHAAGISCWGWQVPRCVQEGDAQIEAKLAVTIAAELQLDGILVDAESGISFFQGDAAAAATYTRTLREALAAIGKSIALSSHDVPSYFPQFPFRSFANEVAFNVPQVYYGSNKSVKERLDRSRNDALNQSLTVPYIPVGAAWVGGQGGCKNAQECATRASQFIQLVQQYGITGYSFWCWDAAPPEFWAVLEKE